ncbi:hypothetical protein [Lentzea sp. E54]|uniref:hypothetical protein n=1 Tax=Lentzea xerophila TaxID=3435883 RepID=UPI003DA34A91
MSEQGQTPPPQEPSSDEPRAAQPAPDQATTPLPADAPATPGQQPTQDQPAATAAETPPAPAAVTPSVAVPAGRGRMRRFAGHRATQLVAVGLLGLVLGGGIVGAVAANRFDDRGGPGHMRMYERGERGPDRGGDRFEQRGPFNDRYDDRGDRFER